MSETRLDLLYVTLFPASPARYGAQRRLEGIMAGLARRHEVTAISLITPDLDGDEAKRAMSEYCREVVLVPARPWHGREKRLVQLRSLFSTRSFETNLFALAALKRALYDVLRRRRFDVVNIEAPYLSRYRLCDAPTGQPLPRLTLDQHNIEFDLVRQMAVSSQGFSRRFHNTVNWRKVRREEITAWRRFDGVTFTSIPDEARARSLVPSLRSEVIPNAVDVRYFKRRPEDPPPDGRTVLFFGAINYFPNIDGILFFLREVWPRISESHPKARVKIVGQHPTPEILAWQGPRIEVAGVVDDVRPHLAGAAVAIVPLRMGGGTRFKILEAMAMGTPIVSTMIGAEGIDVVHERNILIADDPAGFARAVGCFLDDPGMAGRTGSQGRALVEERYSWDAVTDRLERFFLDLVSGQPRF